MKIYFGSLIFPISSLFQTYLCHSQRLSISIEAQLDESLTRPTDAWA